MANENNTNTIGVSQPVYAEFTLLTRSEGDRRATAAAKALQVVSHPKAIEAIAKSDANKAEKAQRKQTLKDLTEKHDLHFLTIREYDAIGDVKNNGGTTVAYRIPFKGANVVEVSTAICNKTDSFDRFLGRCLAAKNFDAGHTIQMKVGGVRYGQYITAAFEYLSAF